MKIGDKLYCIKDGRMGFRDSKFCIKGKTYKIEFFEESIFYFDNYIVVVIIDEENSEHSFNMLNIINGECEYFILKSKKNILIEKNYELLLKKEYIL